MIYFFIFIAWASTLPIAGTIFVDWLFRSSHHSSVFLGGYFTKLCLNRYAYIRWKILVSLRLSPHCENQFQISTPSGIIFLSVQVIGSKLFLRFWFLVLSPSSGCAAKPKPLFCLTSLTNSCVGLLGEISFWLCDC